MKIETLWLKDFLPLRVLLSLSAHLEMLTLFHYYLSVCMIRFFLLIYFANLNYKTVGLLQSKILACRLSTTLSDAEGLLAKEFSVKKNNIAGVRNDRQKGLG